MCEKSECYILWTRVVHYYIVSFLRNVHVLDIAANVRINVQVKNAF